MNCDLILTPAGHLRLQGDNTPDGTTPDAWMKRVRAAFSSSQSRGLLALGGSKPEALLSPSVSFWRDFAGHYLTRLCRRPEFVGKHPDPIDPPLESELAVLVLSAPPLPGGEYLSIEVLGGLWNSKS